MNMVYVIIFYEWDIIVSCGIIVVNYIKMEDVVFLHFYVIKIYGQIIKETLIYNMDFLDLHFTLAH